MYKLFNKISALLVLIVLFPIFLIIYIFLIFEIERPVIFKQKRTGYKGNSFNLYKFRTMRKNKNKNEIQRLYKSTLFLRKTRLDEIPQLINIIKGDLYFVGPRPLLPEYNKLYNKDQKKRQDVMPGITGWAQDNGDNNINWSKKFKLDIWYVQNKSFILDIKIIFLTLSFLFKKITSKRKEKLIANKFNGKN